MLPTAFYLLFQFLIDFGHYYQIYLISESFIFKLPNIIKTAIGRMLNKINFTITSNLITTPNVM